MDNGMMHIDVPKDLGWAADVEMQRAVKEHKSGKRTILSGEAMAKRIDDNFAGIASAYPTKFPTVHTTCPQSLDLTGNNHARCVAMLLGHAVPFDVWIAGDSIHMEPTEAVLNLDLVQALAEKLLNEALSAHGFSSMARIQCGSGIAVVAVHSEYRCKMWVGANAHTLVLDVTDIHGHVHMHVI
jgi:hypothetical protein